MNANLRMVLDHVDPKWSFKDMTVEGAKIELDHLMNCRERINLAIVALIKTGYFTPDQVDDDVAPRITEMYSALKHDKKPMDAINRMLLVEPAKEQFNRDFNELLESARKFLSSMDKHDFHTAIHRMRKALKPFEIPGDKKTCATCGHTL